MSTKNFVSYGDAESLMSGIKDAIDGAGGGGSVKSVTVAEYTDTSVTFNSLAEDIITKFKALTREQQNNLYLYIYRDNTSETSYQVKIYKISIRERAGTPDFFTFTSVLSYNTNEIFRVFYNSNLVYKIEWFVGSNTNVGGTNTLASVNVTKIGFYYNVIEDVTSEVQGELDNLDARVDALEQGGGRNKVIVKEFNGVSYPYNTFTFNKAFESLYSSINSLTAEQLEDLYLEIQYIANGTINSQKIFKCTENFLEGTSHNYYFTRPKSYNSNSLITMSYNSSFISHYYDGSNSDMAGTTVGSEGNKIILFYYE